MRACNEEYSHKTFVVYIVKFYIQQGNFLCKEVCIRNLSLLESETKIETYF
jgi:hypothetical protein